VSTRNLRFFLQPAILIVADQTRTVVGPETDFAGAKRG
jgi:hypothetical protein